MNGARHKTPAPRITGRRRVDLATLTQAQRDALGRDLYDVHCRVFAGVGAEHFAAHVINPPAQRTVVELYLGASGQIVGYCAVHIYRRNAAGQDCIVIRAEAGLLPDYRGRSSTYWFGMTLALAEKLAHPLTPVYYLGTLVHTSSYHLFCKYFPRVYPAPTGHMPAATRTLALDLIDSFDAPPVDATDPLVRDVGWITIETPQETRLRERHGLPDIDFFKSRNPGYRKGHGLVVLVPITFFNVTRAILTRLTELLTHIVTRRQPKL